MTKYSNKNKDRIVELIETDAYTVSDICDMMRISRKTFYEWKNTLPEFAKALEEAEAHCEENLLMKAHLSLQKKLDGYKLTTVTYKYVEDEYGELRLKEKVVKERECPPDTKTIMQIIDRHEEKKEQGKTALEERKPIILTVKTEEERVQYQPVVDEFVRKLKIHPNVSGGSERKDHKKYVNQHCKELNIEPQ